MKKAQFEVIGLLIIVILITLGVLFVVQFVVLREPSNVKQSHVESQFAASFLNSFLETTTDDCRGQTVKGLVHDCVDNPPPLRLSCYDHGTIPQPDSCMYLNKTAFTILNKTLIRLRRAFKFTIDWQDGDMQYVNINNSWEKCSTAERIESKSVHLRVSNKDVDLNLKICS
jgi:hypothetical protein